MLENVEHTARPGMRAERQVLVGKLPPDRNHFAGFACLGIQQMLKDGLQCPRHFCLGNCTMSIRHRHETISAEKVTTAHRCGPIRAFYISQFLPSVFPDIVGAQFAVERLGCDAQQAGRSAAMPVHFVERGKNLFFLQVCKTGGARDCCL